LMNNARIRRTFAASLIAALALGLGACSKPDAPATKVSASTVAAPTLSYEKVLAEGKGFTAGALMSANTVYVLFDPQCPHCGHLWQASQSLLNKAKFVWIPVSIINAKSASQGAALLSAPNPAELMTAHEASLLAGTGGLPDTNAPSPALQATIKTNTQLFNDLALESVPFVVAKNARTGQVVTHSGAMDAEALAKWLGVDGL
jgi:thiol:disulfide interchange protein DsbG